MLGKLRLFSKRRVVAVRWVEAAVRGIHRKAPGGCGIAAWFGECVPRVAEGVDTLSGAL
jgi:hypothetical protein